MAWQARQKRKQLLCRRFVCCTPPYHLTGYNNNKENGKVIGRKKEKAHNIVMEEALSYTT